MRNSPYKEHEPLSEHSKHNFIARIMESRRKEWKVEWLKPTNEQARLACRSIMKDLIMALKATSIKKGVFGKNVYRCWEDVRKGKQVLQYQGWFGLWWSVERWERGIKLLCKNIQQEGEATPDYPNSVFLRVKLRAQGGENG